MFYLKTALIKNCCGDCACGCVVVGLAISLINGSRYVRDMVVSVQKAAGLMLFVGGAQWILANIVSEALYPGYSINLNWISDLGVGPSAAVFNTSMIALGALTLAAAYCLHYALNRRLFTVALTLVGIGAVGVGIFNENYIAPHTVFALTTFIFSAVSAFASSRFINPPFRRLSILAGAIVLAALVLLGAQVHLGIGNGGMERMVAYPAVLWMLGFGGYFMADPTVPFPG